MITVPEGGTVAGRSASVQIEQPDIGGFVAQVADGVAQKMGQIKAKQETYATEKTRLDIVKDIGTERLRFDQMSDPAQIEAEWPVFVQGLNEKYVNAKGPDGKPLLSTEQSQALGLTIQDLTTRHGLALGERTIALTESQATAQWIEARADIANQAATADPDTMVALIEFGEGAIDQRVTDGIIMPDKAAEEKMAFRAEVANARLTGAITSDPATALAELNAGEYNDLGAETVAARKATAQAEIDRRLAAEAKALDVARTEAERAMDAKLTDMAAVAATGVKVADRDLLEDPAYKSRPGYGKAAAAVALADEVPDLASKTPAELAALLEAEKAKAKSEPYQAERELYLDKLVKETTKGWATDALKQAAAAGLPVPPLDMTDTEALPTQIAQRIAFAAHLAKEGYIEDARTGVFFADEKATIKAMTGPEAEFDARLDLATAIAGGTQGSPDVVNRLIGSDPVFAHATRLMVETGWTGIAEAMLRGQQKITAGTAAVPTKQNQIAVFDRVTGGVYDDDPTVKGQIIAAAEAKYADMSRGLNPDGSDSIIPFMDDEAAKAIYAEAVQEVTGAVADGTGALTIGGIQPFRDGMLRLPAGMPVTKVETAMENLERQLQGEVYDAPAGRYGPAESVPGADAPDPLRGLRAASIDGRVPDLSEADVRTASCRPCR